MRDELSFREVFFSECLVGAPFWEYRHNPRLVNVLDRLELLDVFAAGNGRFAILKDRIGEEHLFGPVGIHRDATHRTVALRQKIVHQRVPTGVDPFNLDTHRGRQMIRHVDIYATQLLSLLVELSERRIVSGRTGTELATLLDGA